MTLRYFLVLIIGMHFVSCADDDLTKVPKPGNIYGHVCNTETGQFVPSANVSLEAYNYDGSHLHTYQTTSDDTGYYEFNNVYAGRQLLIIYKNDIDLYEERYIEIEEGVNKSIEFEECVLPSGAISGQICDERLGVWLSEANVYVETSLGLLETTTDQNGDFSISGVPQGQQEVVVRKNEYLKTYNVVVEADQVAEIGEATCEQPDTGDLTGRICADQTAEDYGYWLADALVYIQIGTIRIEDYTDIDGWFTLSDVPAGKHTVEVRRGSFSTSFQVTILANQLNSLMEPQCIDPSNVKLAVVTGVFDQVEEILYALGFKKKEYFSDVYYPTPQTSHPDGSFTPNGNVTIIDGVNTDFFVSHFLSNLDWMEQFDIIFFNCGLQDLYFIGSPAAISNLNTYVMNGKSIYVSDYASELLRLAFPDKIDWIGAENVAHAARVGTVNNSLEALVRQIDLAAAMGDTTPSDGLEVSINYNDPHWVVMESLAIQEALGSTVWVTADVDITLDSESRIVKDSALMVSFGIGEEGGTVIHTTFHNHTQVNESMKRILKYVIFEL